MADLGKLTSLNLLNINGTAIDSGFEHLQKCAKLQWILIGGLTISDEQATNISKIPGITHITLSPATKVSDAGMKSLKSVPDCTVDTVGDAAPSDPAPQ